MRFMDFESGVLHCGDTLTELSKLTDESVDMCVTSPPYWGLRDYHIEGQIGLEDTPEKYVCRLVDVFEGVKRVLSKDGTLWLNIGDSYYGSGCGPTGNKGPPDEQRANASKGRKYTYGKYKPKDLVGIPWTLAFALRESGWYLRQDIVWAKPNPMPESVRDRCTKSHEYVFLFSKSRKYHYDHEAIKEPAEWKRWGNQTTIKQQQGTAKWIGDKSKEELCSRTTKNKRSVWTIPTKPYSDAHFATFPPDLVRPCVLAGCPEYGVVLDPFIGSGTTAVVAASLNRKWIGIDIHPDYCELATIRILSNAPRKDTPQ